jgi:LPXTG-site transpeptidase (sortase) family protein
MDRKNFIGLDNAAFRGRLRTHQSRSVRVVPRAQASYSRVLTDFVNRSAAQPTKAPIKSNQLRRNVARTAKPRPQRSNVLQRQAVSTYRQNTTKPKTKKSLSFKRAFIPSLAILLFMTGLGVSAQAFRANKKITATVHAMSQQSSQNSEDNVDAPPDETAATSSSVSGYKVSPDMPRYVRIAKINVSARVTRMGIKSNNELKAPGNIYDVGWYENSSKPGDAGGAALFDAHVSGPTKTGVFYNLKKLVVGDTVEVERGDGKKLLYKVVKSQVYDKDKVDMASALVSAVPGKAGLNLMTCTGQIKGSDYSQRLVVYTVAQ